MTPATYTISAHSLGIYDRCRRAFRHYRIDNRRAVRSAAGLIAGTAIHAGLDKLYSGASVLTQESAINAVLDATPTPLDDYRNAAYLRDALALFRVELADVFRGWTIEERETQGTVKLGEVLAADHEDPAGISIRHVSVLWEFRRDLVALSPEGLRLVVDWKTSSRNEDAHYLALKVSGQLMGYCWSWQAQHPDKPVHGALPVRLIMRRPSRSGVCYELPRDNPIFFPPERLAEWHRHTLRKVQELLSRNPADPDDWPLSAAELGCCRHTFGVCEYAPVCSLKPEDRPRMLASDAYEDSDIEDTAPAVQTGGGTGNEPFQSPIPNTQHPTP